VVRELVEVERLRGVGRSRDAAVGRDPDVDAAGLRVEQRLADAVDGDAEDPAAGRHRLDQAHELVDRVVVEPGRALARAIGPGEEEPRRMARELGACGAAGLERERRRRDRRGVGRVVGGIRDVAGLLVVGQVVVDGVLGAARGRKQEEAKPARHARRSARAAPARNPAEPRAPPGIAGGREAPAATGRVQPAAARASAPRRRRARKHPARISRACQESFRMPWRWDVSRLARAAQTDVILRRESAFGCLRTCNPAAIAGAYLHREIRARPLHRASMQRSSTLLVAALLTATLAACVDDGAVDTSTDDAEITQPVYPAAHPRIYLTPNRTRLANALAANTPAAARFKSAVDSYVAGSDIWGFGAWNAALMGQLTGQSKYCTKAVAVVQAQVAAAEAAIAAGTAPTVAGDSYLEIGDMVGDLALTHDWCYAQVTATQRSHWIAYANQAVWNVWNHASAKWGSKAFSWSGWSVDNPSDNNYYSFLRATILLGLATKGENAQADTWLTTFRQSKILDELVPTFNADLVGGAVGAQHRVSRDRHWRAVHALGLDQDGDVGEPDRRPLHRIARAPGSGVADDLQGRVARVRRERGLALQPQPGHDRA
jgi:hypothetical protein